jgi:hypothetical protein
VSLGGRRRGPDRRGRCRLLTPRYSVRLRQIVKSVDPSNIAMTDRSICMFLSPRLNRTMHENAGWHSILARPGPQSAHTRVVSRAGGQSPLWVVNRVILVVGRPLPTFPWKRTSFLRTRCDFLVIPFQAEIEERPMTKPGLFLA